MSADKSDCGLIAVCLRQNECSNPLPSPCRHGRMRRSVSVILRTTAMHDMIAHPRMSAPLVSPALAPFPSHKQHNSTTACMHLREGNTYRSTQRKSDLTQREGAGGG